MKLFIGYFKEYFNKDFNLLQHLLVFFFIGLCLFLNYSYDLYPDYVRISNRTELGILKQWGMYSFAFLVPLLIIGVTQKQKWAIIKPNYVLIGLLGLVFVSVDVSYYLMNFHKLLVESDSVYYRFSHACLSNLVSLFSVVIPLIILYNLIKIFHPEWYGLKLNGAPIKPYVWIILIMIPIVFLASFQEGFTKYYPSFSKSLVDGIPYPDWLKVGIYELCYGFDFFSVELFFRGFMVVALSRFVGKEAILPMVACYAFLHFGKPWMEAFSSIFGGFALGILAYKSRNIYGGLLVHLGVAWGMEIAAFAQIKWLLN
ncbi:MAG: CPBP family intramembrane glutamic endopeptidase [Flavobacteriales bacterium]